MIDSTNELNESAIVPAPVYATELHGQLSELSVDEPAPAPARRNIWRYIGWLIGMVAIGLVAGSVIVLFLKYVDGPVEGETMTTLASVKAVSAPKPVAPSLLSGLNIDFQYPAVFDSVAQVKTDSQSLEQYNIGSKADYRRSITVNVRPLASGNLDDDSSYRFRQLNTDLYRSASKQINGEPIVIMTKTDGAEQILFWAHARKAVTITITSNNPRDNITDIMAVISSTLRWRQ